ncbi:Rha family transcriptional regulator [Enterovibrio norvegicus]|uniref:Rha family transcriptional regulator n=1 Tax=Enterovibrio norvegicus TaxID=188144 RepID=UPI000C84F193|nr:Rha family transcriptional regulator [Enterovibrio norvegicus]PMN68388.1 Rha family transcriptional regulator [Enterovibrio norvegicus]
MSSIQIAVDAPFITKKEFLKRTGLTSDTFERLKADGDIIIMPKRGVKNAVLVNMIAMTKKAVEQSA